MGWSLEYSMLVEILEEGSNMSNHQSRSIQIKERVRRCVRRGLELVELV